MQTLKQVLGRETDNLKNVGICVLVVLVLIGISFGLVHMKFSVSSQPAAGGATPIVSEARNGL